MIPQLIYSRTAAGNASALNPLSSLPRKARALLISLDGRTDIETCVARSNSADETLAMLDLLVTAGLVEGRSSLAAARERPAPASKPPEDDGLKSEVRGVAPPEAKPYASQADGTGRTARPTTFEIKNVVTLMTDFVMQHLPERSLEIILALEGVTSMQQLASALTGYAALIADAGDAGKVHLREIQRLIS